MKIVAFVLGISFLATLFASCYSAPVDYDLFESSPALTIEVEIHAQTATKLKELLAEFTAANDYQIYVGRVHPKNPEFNIILWREDSMIIGVNPFEFRAYRFSLYPALVEPVSQDTLTSILAELKLALRAT